VHRGASVVSETPDTPSTEALRAKADARPWPYTSDRADTVRQEAADTSGHGPCDYNGGPGSDQCPHGVFFRGDEEYDTLRDYWDGLSHKGQWEAFFEAARQRDLAIAHDRQPYPTAEAYETLAAAHAKYKAMYRQAAEWITDVQMHYVLGPEATPEDVFMVAKESQEAADTSGLPGTCDWGGCDNIALLARHDPDKGWLPVCQWHAADASSADLAPLCSPTTETPA
jgi:hypothetical protein